MKNLVILLICLFSIENLSAQIQLRPLPQEGFEQRISDYIYSLELADSHEHLMPQVGVKNSSMLDFMLLLHHYADDDIKSAGMSKTQFAELLTEKYSVEEKWDIVKPYWEASKNTAYNRVVLLAMNKLYNIKDLNDDNVVELSKAIKKSYEGDWYNYVLKEKAKIKYAIMDVGSRREKDDMFRYVEKFDQFLRVDSKNSLKDISEQSSVEINSMDSFIMAMEKSFSKAVDRGIVGVKSAAAYHRILEYDKVSKDVAEKVFSNIINSQNDGTLEFDEVKPLQDYMMHRIIQLARKYDLPMQIHTGLHAGDGNYISNSNPSLLANLFLEYRDMNFVLFHGGYPYGGELATLAKNFRNVFLDMSWIYVISPSYAERYLHEWIETVPSNKIMAFGGDYHNVENAYGHSLMARAVVSKVLIEKVSTGYFTEAEAMQIAERILFSNVVEFFRIRNF